MLSHTFRRRIRRQGKLDSYKCRRRILDSKLAIGLANVVVGMQAEDEFGMGGARLGSAREVGLEGQLGCEEELVVGEDGGGVEEGIVVVWVGGEELGAQVWRVADGLEEGDVDGVGGVVGEGDGVDGRHYEEGVRVWLDRSARVPERVCVFLRGLCFIKWTALQVEAETVANY